MDIDYVKGKEISPYFNSPSWEVEIKNILQISSKEAQAIAIFLMII